MKHIQAFHGSVTSLLVKRGLDSVAVLNACNAYRGSVKVADSDHKSVTTLSGKISAKGMDNRKLTFKDSITEKSATGKGNVPAPGQLLAFSDWLRKGTDTFGASLEITEFPPDVEDWLSVKAQTFAPVQGCAEPAKA